MLSSEINQGYLWIHTIYLECWKCYWYLHK